MQVQLQRGRKKKTLQKTKTLQLKNALKCIAEYLPPDTVSFIESQVEMSKRCKRAYRWKTRDKMIDLSIFFHSRKVYKILSKLFVLPSKSTLLRDLKRMNMKPGFIESILEALQVKVNTMDTRDQNVALVFDEMSIKEDLTYNTGRDIVEGFEDFGLAGQTRFLTNHAIAFIVKGLASKWKQPIGYFLSAGPIKASVLQMLTKCCITKLQAIGLNVVALICDQGSNNRSFLGKMGENVSVNRSYIMYNDRKIFVIYDPPLLLKNVRNNLKKGDLNVNGNLVSWQHVVDFYYFDKSHEIRMAPKLTDKHIDLSPFMSMRVNLAAQVLLSHSVAAGISFLTRVKELPESAIYTAQFIEHFDALFNTFNSCSQRLGHAFNDSSGHHAFLWEILSLLDNVKTMDGKELPCTQGWKININGLLGLWHYLKTEQQFQFLLTRKLNQDCAENLFSIIRGRGGN